MADQIKLPKTKEIETLPRWASVAFAARCARRVLPLFKAPDEYLTAVTHAVHIAEQAAATAVIAAHTAFDDAYAALGASANAVTGVSIPAIIATDAPATSRAANGAAATTVYAIAAAAALPAGSSPPASHAAAAAYAAAAADAAADAAAAVDDTTILIAREHTIQSIVRDFTTLREVAFRLNWEDSTPVPPSVFGPLWPDGPPLGWPIEEPLSPHPINSPAFTKIAIKALIQPDVAPETVRDGLIELYRAMNEYHMARGAGVLTLEDFRRFVRAEVAVEV